MYPGLFGEDSLITLEQARSLVIEQLTALYLVLERWQRMRVLS